NNGTLKVESDAPGEIEIEIVDDKTLVVRRQSITTEGADITLPVGDYRVRLPGVSGDRITVSEDGVVIQRGVTKVVTLDWNSRNSDSDVARSQNEPTPKPTPAAGKDLRKRYEALRDAFQESMTEEELRDFVNERAPLLGRLPADAANALLQFLTELPEEAHRTLLDDGYVKYAAKDLDWQRQEQLHRFLPELLVAAPSSVDPDSSKTNGLTPSMVLASDVGLVILDEFDSSRQVIGLFHITSAMPPSVAAVLGESVGGTWGDPDVEADWQRQVVRLRDVPYSARLQPLPSRFTKEFLPATRMPLTTWGVLREFVAGAAAWRINAADSRTVRMFALNPPVLEDCVLTYRVRMATDNVEGRVFLEMRCRFSDQEAVLSRGFHHAVSGSNDWDVYETPLLLRQGQIPEKIELNLVIEGGGTVRISAAELIATPARGAESNPRNPGD
ncbi:MAG: hypothetical protein AAF961_07570, partial [Planctomycetota bacterium]